MGMGMGMVWPSFTFLRGPAPLPQCSRARVPFTALIHTYLGCMLVGATRPPLSPSHNSMTFLLHCSCIGLLVHVYVPTRLRVHVHVHVHVHLCVRRCVHRGCVRSAQSSAATGDGGLLFLSQRPYISQGSLRSQVLYPCEDPEADPHTDKQLEVCWRVMLLLLLLHAAYVADYGGAADTDASVASCGGVADVDATVADYGGLC